MAELVNTNPVVIRRILGPLREAGLVTSQPGPGGGWRLSRPPAEITLRDVYRAIEEDRPRGHEAVEVDGGRMHSECLYGVLSRCYREAEATLEAKLAQVTVADVIRAVRSDRSGAVPFEGLPFAEEHVVRMK